MEIEVDFNITEPVFAQLIRQIKDAVSAALLRPGDPLPPIRQLAADLELNTKTVAKAYRLLERDSVVQTQGYRGTFIHPDAEANSAIDLNVWLGDQLRDKLAELRTSGATDSEIRVAFNNAMNERGLPRKSGVRREGHQ
ncbi:MAG: GntR family transcriptional regulator [Gammaproteobacteria bacterium]|nr:GntR family transcriptional regulator [Gammaproteobacteria bacterium]